VVPSTRSDFIREPQRASNKRKHEEEKAVSTSKKEMHKKAKM
jgi:hypothetical protein